jgi:hypothetical protein
VEAAPWILFEPACLDLEAAAVCMDLAERCDQTTGEQSRTLEMLMDNHGEIRC